MQNFSMSNACLTLDIYGRLMSSREKQKAHNSRVKNNKNDIHHVNGDINVPTDSTVTKRKQSPTTNTMSKRKINADQQTVPVDIGEVIVISVENRR